jgi:hypothetical protein
VCQKGEHYQWNIPNPTYTYNQIQTLNNGKYKIVFIPEYHSHTNWEVTKQWLANNFSGLDGIPIMLDIAGGWDYWLTIQDIKGAIAIANVQWLRISELASYCIEQNKTFPSQYITSVLELAKENNLRVYWCEWKIDYQEHVRTFNAILDHIKGFEEVVFVGFKTNSGDLEPAQGFQYVIDKGFENIGATVESWYWETRHRIDNPDIADPQNMPISLLIQHALEARAAGVKIIQFEPYWYFFNNGEPTENLKLLSQTLTA